MEEPGDLVWFDPGIGYMLPGEVVEFSRPAQVITVQAIINNKPQTFTLHNLQNVQKRQDLGERGVDDMILFTDLNEASLLWNLKIRFENENIYTYTGSILVSVNPYRMFDMYGLENVKKYEGQILGTLSPHLFAIGSAAYSCMSKDCENQVVIISGESGAGKTESTKLIMQYLAAVNKSPSNLITEQILEASPLLESFGNAKTVRNDNSSRFGKYLEVHFKDGVITGAKTTEYLLEKSRIVTQATEERNYHVFYEMLDGLSDDEKEKYGLQSAEKYFYLSQGGNPEIPGKNDEENFRSLLAAMQVLGFTLEEQDTIFRILASVLHFGNIYFNRKKLKHGQEGVELGSDGEVRWTSHLLKIPVEGILRALTTRTTETRNERMITPLNIDQSLDVRDAVAKSLYSNLFSWLVQRINKIVCKGSKKTSIAILDIFGFEDFRENSFEQLCINYANENLQYHFNKHIFKLEQQDYAKEKIDWQIINYEDNQPVLNLIGKKPVGIFPLLDDESNFPKASDMSFLEKCHYNHALNELYSRPRMSSMEFGIRHYAGQVWYSVDSFLDKNKDTLRYDVMDLLISSQLPMISAMFQEVRNTAEAAKTMNRSDGRFITMKPRAPTVAARFQDSLQNLLDTMSKCHPWFVRCIKPNNEKQPMKFDLPIVLEQLRYTGMLETIRIRKLGYPIRLKYQQFAERFRCLVPGHVPRGAPYKEVCRIILECIPDCREDYQLGSSKVFIKELMEKRLETERVGVLQGSVITVQKWVRGYLIRKRYLTMRRNAIKVQAWYRGARDRQRYQKFRKGVLRAQATYRMRLQKREYEKIKAILARKQEADRLALERAKQRMVREEQERTSRAVAGVNHLEIPAELAFIFSKLEDWVCINNDRNITKAVNLSAKPAHYRLPYDIDQYAFTKFTNVYFKAHVWAMKREPIKTPFLAKTNEVDYQESLAIFKLILRFMNDNNLSGKKERALADYIVQKGLMNDAMRDEIICQLCNQTWKNENDANKERGWLLMANCLSCFPPGKILNKYLLKFVSDHAHDGYKGFCQKKLLQSEKVDSQNARTYPPSLLEWKSNAKKANMALEAKFADGGSICAPIESWSTGESFASSLLTARGLDEDFGWTVDLCDDGDVYELNGNDYVLDLISELEVPPAFPVCKSYFLVSADKSKTEAGVKHRRSGWGSSPHNPDRINTFEIEIEEAPPAPIRHRPPSPVGLPRSPTRPNERPPAPPHQHERFASVERTPQHQHERFASIDRVPQHHYERSNHIERTRDQPLPPPPVSRGHEETRENHSKRHHDERTVVEQHGTTEEENTLRNGRQQQRLKSRSLDQLLDSNMDNVLSKKSALNGRYFDGSNSNLHNGNQPEDKVSPPRYSEVEPPMLSETSKLNKRYLLKKVAPPRTLEIQRPTSPPPPVPISLPSSPISPNDWQQGMGLSQSALNNRYFNGKNDNSLLVMKGIPRIGRTSAASLQDLRNVNGHHKLLNGRDSSPLPALPVRSSMDETDGRGCSRPSSRNSEDLGVDFPEFDITELRSSHDEQEDMEDHNGTDKYSHRTTESTRYVKYTTANKAPPPARIYGHSTKAHIDKSRDPSEYLGPRSSAMSDTSEAPSLASHVKNVRIPSHTSELDQYLDDLFNPVLDGNLDELSDARSLAASIKGGNSPPCAVSNNYMEDVFDNLFQDEFSSLQNAEELVGKLKGGGSRPDTKEKPGLTKPNNLDSYLDGLFQPPSDCDVRDLVDPENLVTSLKGGGHMAGGVEMQSNPMASGFNVPLGVNPMSPPMVNVALPGGMPPSVNTNLSMFSLGGSPTPTFPNSPMQYPYMPVYNVAGMSVPMVDTSQIIQQQFLQQQMVQMQQRAFLASAVQQNLQIQQQLLHQNQALQQLLQTAVVSPTSPPPNSQNLLAQVTSTPADPPSSLGMGIPPTLLAPMTPAPMFPGSMVPTFPAPGSIPPKIDSSKAPFLPPKMSRLEITTTPKDAFGDVLSELRSKTVAEEPPMVLRSQAPRMYSEFGIPPPPPPPPPPLPPIDDKFPDVYGRAKTVRIGKWRWPPPREDGTQPNSYIEFKMKKHMERNEDSREDSEDFVEFDEIPDSAMMSPGVDEGPEPGPVKRSSSEPVLQEVQISKPLAMTSQKSQESLISEPPSRRLKSFDGGKPAGSIGKLRISSEMKAKLEQLTLDHSIRSSHKDPRARAFPKKTDTPIEGMGTAVRKLAENRKSVIEQKLFSSPMMDQTDVAPRPRTERRTEETSPEMDAMHLDKTPQDFSVENLVKSQVERMERASRFMRERKEELGHPMALQQPLPSRTSTQHAEYGVPSSQTSSRMDKILYEQSQSSQNSKSVIYEESLASSRSMYSHQNQVLPQSLYSTQLAPASSRPTAFSPKKFAQPPLHAPSITASSGYYAPSTPVVARRREPPPPIAPSKLFQDHKVAADRIEFEESSEFLKPIDTAPPPGLDIASQRLAVDNIKTKLFGPSNAPYFTYTKTSWELRVRKEVFSPNEKLENPLALHLVFCQIVQDIVAPSCIRLNREEKRKIGQLLEGYGINAHNMNSSHHKLAIKRSVVDMTKDCPNYFSRLFPISGGRNLPNVQLLGISHSGVRLVRRERDAICDYLRVLDMLSFDDIAEVAVPQASTLQILLRNGGWMTLYSHKSSQIKDLIERFAVEAAQGSEEYMRAVADYVTKESTLLSFRKGDIIRLVKNKNMHLDKGWLFGVLESGENGIFPCEYVVPLGRHEAHRTNKTVEKVTEVLPQPSAHVISSRENNLHAVEDNIPLWVESKVEIVDEVRSEVSHMTTPANDGKYSLLQYALFNFRESVDKYDMLKTHDGSIRGSIKMIESIKSNKNNKKGKKSKDSDWTWKELADLVKYTKSPIQASLLKFDLLELNKLSIECFVAIMRYMGDYPMAKNQTEVDCVYTILVNCHKHPQLRDEVYCQIMKQTTNNKSSKADSCQRGWRLFSIIGAYFECTEALKMYLIKFLETAAYDKRRAYHGTAMVCLQNLRKTLKYGGRKNVPSIEEIAAISAGRNSKRQIYRLPGGTERVINTKSTTVVEDILEEICYVLNIHTPLEMEEFSLYCIVEGDPYSMPLNREEYILDVTTELLKNGQVFYLIFCRSVWFHPLKLDNQLYIEVIFNQVAPDYLEGLLLVLPSEQLADTSVSDIARIAALLHRAADMDHVPAKEEVKYLLPKPVLGLRNIRPAQWVEMVQRNWPDMTALTTTEAKAQCLDILQTWPLFGSCFFAVKWIRGNNQQPENILALNRDGVHFLDVTSHETVWKYPFSEVISTRKVRAEDGTLFLDMKCGNLMVQKITRIQTDQAHEVSRLIRQYINIEQRQRGRSRSDKPRDVTLSRQ